MNKDTLMAIKNSKDLMLPSVDFVFCLLFGTEKNKDRLISLLNSILNGKPHIKDVIIDPTEYKKTYNEGRAIRLDIKATTDNGTIINVEMQCVDTKYIIHRAELYNAMLLRDVIIREWDTFDTIPDRISIWITKSKAVARYGYMHEILLMFKATQYEPIEIASEKYRLLIVELPKLDDYEPESVGQMFKPWMSFIKDPQHMPDEYLKIKELQDAVEELNYLSHDSQTRADYVYRMKEINDVINAKSESYADGKEAGLKEGKEAGLKEGEEIGVKKGAQEAALNALSLGLSIDMASKISGLTEEEIRRLNNDK